MGGDRKASPAGPPTPPRGQGLPAKGVNHRATRVPRSPAPGPRALHSHSRAPAVRTHLQGWGGGGHRALRRAQEPGGAGPRLTHNRRREVAGGGRRAREPEGKAEARARGSRTSSPPAAPPRAPRLPAAARPGTGLRSWGAGRKEAPGLAWRRSGSTVRRPWLHPQHSVSARSSSREASGTVDRLLRRRRDNSQCFSLGTAFRLFAGWFCRSLTVAIPSPHCTRSNDPMKPLTGPGARIAPCYLWLPPKEKHELHQQKRNRNRKESFWKG